MTSISDRIRSASHSEQKHRRTAGAMVPVRLVRGDHSFLPLLPSPSFSVGVVSPPLDRAIALLQSTSFVDEKKQQIFDADVLRAMRGLFPAGKAYQFDMVAFTSIGTPSATFIASTLPISPAVATYSEWASLASLFDEVKLVKAKLLFMPMVGSNGQSLASSTSTMVTVSAFVCGVNHDNISSSPASYAAVARLAKSANVVRCVGDTAGTVTTMSFSAPRGLIWARTVTPAVQDPPAGVLGSFDFASDPASVLNVTTVYYKNMLRTTVALRNRA
jgi:hypothetical protein